MRIEYTCADGSRTLAKWPSLALLYWLGRSHPPRPIDNPEPFQFYVVGPPVTSDDHEMFLTLVYAEVERRWNKTPPFEIEPPNPKKNHGGKKCYLRLHTMVFDYFAHSDPEIGFGFGSYLGPFPVKKLISLLRAHPDCVDITDVAWSAADAKGKEYWRHIKSGRLWAVCDSPTHAKALLAGKDNPEHTLRLETHPEYVQVYAWRRDTTTLNEILYQWLGTPRPMKNGGDFIAVVGNSVVKFTD